MSAPASATSTVANLEAIDLRTIPTLYRQFNAHAPPPGHGVLTGQYENRRAGTVSDLHVFNGVLQAVSRTGSWRGISLSSDLKSLKKAFKSKQAKFYQIDVAGLLAVSTEFQILQDPARRDHWGLSTCSNMQTDAFDRLLEQAQTTASIMTMVAAAEASGDSDSDDSDGFLPAAEQSIYTRALVTKWQKEQTDEEVIKCLFSFAHAYADRKRLSNDLNDFLSNDSSFKNRMTMRDRSFLVDAFREHAATLYNEDKGIYDDDWSSHLLLQEARELFIIPLFTMLKRSPVATSRWASIVTFEQVTSAVLDLDDEIDLNDVVRAQNLSKPNRLSDYSSLANFINALPEYESDEEDDEISSCKEAAAATIALTHARSPPATS